MKKLLVGRGAFFKILRILCGFLLRLRTTFLSAHLSLLTGSRAGLVLRLSPRTATGITAAHRDGAPC
jgi:hypothetical protein